MNSYQNWLSPEGALVILNLLVFVAILIQAAIYKKQLGVMRKDYDVLERQAATFEGQAATMQSQLDAIHEQGEIMRQSLAATRRLVDQNERAIKAAEDSAKVAHEAFYIGEAPYFGIKEITYSDFAEGYCPRVSIIFQNGGRTPAWHFYSTAKFSLDNPDSADFWIIHAEPGNLSESFFPPSEQKPVRYINRDFRLTPERWAAITQDSRHLFLVVMVEYGDLRRKHHTQQFRYVYYPSSMKFGDYDTD